MARGNKTGATPPQGEIIVAAGVNGAGKSTIIGRYASSQGYAYFNPDERTRELMAAGFPEPEANARSWKEGYQALRHAVTEGRSFMFETTLGGNSIVKELFRALAIGRRVTIYYVGLNSVELHIARVAARVGRGGHDIPEAKIRERFTKSRENLLGFIGTKANIRLWDNSAEDPQGHPMPADVMTIEDGVLKYPLGKKALRATPGWARPIVQRAIEMLG